MSVAVVDESQAHEPGVRRVGSTMRLRLFEPTSVVLAVQVASGWPVGGERLRVQLEDIDVPMHEIDDDHGGRLQAFTVGAGDLRVRFEAEVTGAGPAAPLHPVDTVRYIRPSRYCESDALVDTARAEFGGLVGAELAFAVTEWVHERLRYTPGASAPTDGALATLASGAGVCRDFAHLEIAMLRALDTPARLVAVYAPGLTPMDFHAVVEALVDGRWLVFDPTRLAPRRAMVRIATGRDAADTAFVTNTLADLELLELEVDATAERLPIEDPGEAVVLR